MIIQGIRILFNSILHNSGYIEEIVRNLDVMNKCCSVMINRQVTWIPACAGMTERSYFRYCDEIVGCQDDTNEVDGECNV